MSRPRAPESGATLAAQAPTIACPMLAITPMLARAPRVAVFRDRGVIAR